MGKMTLKRDLVLARQAAYKSQCEKFDRDTDHTFAIIEDTVRNQLGNLLPGLTIDVGTNYGSCKYVTVRNTKHFLLPDNTKALSWKFTAWMNEHGIIKFESNSFSGLQATTIQNIEDLELTVKQLKALNSLNWGQILNIPLPKYKEYVLEKPITKNDLMQADIQDAIESNVLLKGKENSGKYTPGEVYYGIIKDSGSQFTIFEVRPSEVPNITTDQLMSAALSTTYRIKKENFYNKLVY